MRFCSHRRGGYEMFTAERVRPKEMPAPEAVVVFTASGRRVGVSDPRWNNTFDTLMYARGRCDGPELDWYRSKALRAVMTISTRPHLPEPSEDSDAGGSDHLPLYRPLRGDK